MPGWTETPLDADEAHRHPYELWYASPPGAAEIEAPRPDRYYPQIVALEFSVSGKTTPLGAFLSRALAAWQALTRPAPAGGSAPFVATPHDAAYAFAALMRAIHAGEAARTELLLFLRGDLLQSPLERHLPRPENAALAVTSAQILRGDTGLQKPPGVAETLDWAQALHHLGCAELDLETAARTLGALVKYREDADRVKHALDRLLTT